MKWPIILSPGKAQCDLSVDQLSKSIFEWSNRCQFGTMAMKVHVNGLTGIQWAWCICLSLFTFPMNFILKFVPDTWFYDMGKEDPKEVEKF